jgi:hypothetical protein
VQRLPDISSSPVKKDPRPRHTMRVRFQRPEWISDFREARQIILRNVIAEIVD